jgi:hypothetical protein
VFFAACAWGLLGFAASEIERASTPSNLASTLIESGKLDASSALRWRGSLRSDPLELPWAILYDIDLDEVEPAANALPVSGGLRLTYYLPDSPSPEPPPARAGDRVEVLARATTVRNFGDPGAFDYRGYLARQNVQLQHTAKRRAPHGCRPPAPGIGGTVRAPAWTAPSGRSMTCSAPGLDEGARARHAARRPQLRRARSHHGLPEDRRVSRASACGTARARWPRSLAGGTPSAARLFPRVALTILVLAAYASIVEDRPIVRAVLMAAIYLCAQLLYRRMDLLNVAALAALS